MPLLSNPWVILALVLTEIGLLTGAYHYGDKRGQEHVIAEQAKMQSIEDRTREAALKATAEQISQIKVINEYKTQKLATETVEKPVYRDCVNTDASYGLLNDALTAPEDRHDADPSVVPKADPAH